MAEEKSLLSQNEELIRDHSSGEYKAIHFFFLRLNNAYKNGLHYEFMEFFLDNFVDSKDIREACFHADCELYL